VTKRGDAVLSLNTIPERLRGRKWLLLFLLFIVVFGLVLSFELARMSIVWDETPHLDGGLLIYQGKLGEYFMFSRYPPLMDLFIAGYFGVFGTNVFAARLVSVTFALLTIAAVFVFATRAYGRRVAFISCLILASMPGFIWLSRVSLLEMPLEFFFVSSLLLFLYWLNNGKNSAITICGLLLGVATLVKYQAVVAGLVIIAALPLLLYRSSLKPKISRLPLMIIGAAIILVPSFISIYSTGILGQWIGLLQSSDTLSNIYAARFPTPIFYILEMTQPLPNIHPINLIIFCLGIAGLVLFAWRHKPEDRLLFVWFLVVYLFFTLVATKSWRYVLPLFPVIAISAASFIAYTYGKLQSIWRTKLTAANKKLIAKLLAGFLSVFTITAVFASGIDAYNWFLADSTYVPLPEAAHYIANGFENANESVMIVCGVNTMNQKATSFYLAAYESKPNKVWLYPLEPADTYAPNFNITQLLIICKQNNVKYLLLYENKNQYFFHSTLNTVIVVESMIQSGEIYYQTAFGVQPNRIFIFQFNQTVLQT
jgi:asparagine N-glycosylation enzyme membrane subunit Stt3